MLTKSIVINLKNVNIRRENLCGQSRTSTSSYKGNSKRILTIYKDNLVENLRYDWQVNIFGRIGSNQKLEFIHKDTLTRIAHLHDQIVAVVGRNHTCTLSATQTQNSVCEYSVSVYTTRNVSLISFFFN